MLCLGALGLFLWATVLPARDAPGYDLAPLAGAGRLVATGQEAHLYAHDPVHYNRTGSDVFDAAVGDVGFALGSTPYVYPPLVAVAMQPVARVSFPTVMRWWTFVSAAFLLAGLWLTLEIYLPRANRPLAFAGAVLALLVFEPVRYGFWLGQTTAFIFVLMLLALLLQRRGRDAAAGIALALAAFVKLTPIVLAAIWLWRGPRRAFAWFAGALALLWGVSLAVMGSGLHVEYLARMRHIGRTVLVAYNNHSLLAFLTRRRVDDEAIHYWRQHTPTASDQAILALLVAVVAAAALVLVRRVPAERDADWRPLAEGLAFVTILLVPSIAWTHYFVLLLPVVAIAASRRPLPGAPGVYAALTLAFLLCSRLLIPDQTAFSPAAHHVVAGPTFAALIALGTLLWLIATTRLDPRRAVRAASPGSVPQD